ncbi:hypothetical protein LCGC14_1403920, partial [marine sediment metagenome]
PNIYTLKNLIYIMGKSKNENPALIDNQAHSLIIIESATRKTSKKWSREECSYKYLISEAIKQIYGDK